MFGSSSAYLGALALLACAVPATYRIAGSSAAWTWIPAGRPGTAIAIIQQRDWPSQVRTPAEADTETVFDTSVRTERDRLVEFHRHVRSNRFGFFIGEDQMAATHLEFTSDALRRIPGVTVRPSRGIGNQVRIRGCAPLVWVDGERAPGAELDDVTHGNDVAALEIYLSLTGVPPEFADRSATCGTILAWMKAD